MNERGWRRGIGEESIVALLAAVKEEAGAACPEDNAVAASMLITNGTGGELITHDSLLVGIKKDSSRTRKFAIRHLTHPDGYKI